MLLRFVSVVVVMVAAAVVASPGAAITRGPGTPVPAAAPKPVPSLTPAATGKLWAALVRRSGRHRFTTAECRSLRAVFYAATDWLRLSTKLAATASPCAHYYVSVPPLVADKTQPRADQAWRIRALGPSFHALAEVNVTGWTSWVAATGNSWYAAGVEARRRMAAAGYDVGAGDTWALNELSSAVRQGTGNARANMRAFLNGLHDGDGTGAARGVVFTAGIGQATSDLSVYQARLQDWYEDAAFWGDMSRVTSDWSQEVYGDVRHYAVAGVHRDARRDALNEYLQHQLSLGNAAPASASTARAFLGGSYAPLANAAWQYDAAFGWTNVSVELMQDYVSAQTYALRSAGTGRFGFAWSPKNLAAMPAAEFTAQTDALLVRLAAAIADSAESPDGACGTAWCSRDLDGATLTSSWRRLATWKPSRLTFATLAQTLAPATTSAPIAVELQTSSGIAYTAGVPVPVELATTSATAELSPGAGGPWTPTLTVLIGSGASTASFYFRDPSSGSVTVTAAAAGKTAGTQTVTVVSQPEPPPPAGGGGSGGGGGAAPDIAVEATAAPAAPAVGDALTYTVRVRNHSGPASRVFLLVRLPTQVAYAASETDRGPGCTGTANLTCDLDFLSGELVATLRVHATVREAGALSFTASSSSEPADTQPANDTVNLSTTVAARTQVAVAPDLPPALRAVPGARAKVALRSGVAVVSLRFSVSEPARLEARVTSVRSLKPLALLPSTSLAGTRSRKQRSVAIATVPRAGTYVFTARVPARKLVRGRTYLLRLTARDSAGMKRGLTIRVTG